MIKITKEQAKLKRQIVKLEKEFEAAKVEVATLRAELNPLNPTPAIAHIQALRCIIACENANGEPDLYFVILRCTVTEVSMDINYILARGAAAREGYSLEASVVFFNYDAAGRALEALFEWDTAPVIDSPGVKELQK